MLLDLVSIFIRYRGTVRYSTSNKKQNKKNNKRFLPTSVPNDSWRQSIYNQSCFQILHCNKEVWCTVEQDDKGFLSGKAKYSMYFTICGQEDMNRSKYNDALFSSNDLRQRNYQPNQTSYSSTKIKVYKEILFWSVMNGCKT